MEIPLDLIKQVRISLRRHANIPSYEPNDKSFSDLPSVEEAVTALDRAAGLPRCRHCEGALLRGPQSSICVFCGGGEPFDGVAHERLNFRNTLAFRWLLQSLDLDGSEIVPVSVEANNKNRGRTTISNEIPLSDLLDLEIKWPSELEKFGSRLSSEPVQGSKASVISSATPYNASIEPSVPVYQSQTNNLTLFESAQINETDKNPKESIQVQNNLNLFENAQSSKAAPLSTEDESHDTDSGWGVNFQSTPSGGANVESTPVDPFVGSSDLSAHMDAVFGPAKDSSSHEKESVSTIESASVANDWFSDNSWNDDPSSGLSGLPQEIKVNTSLVNGSEVENTKYSLTTLTDITKEHDKNADEGDDSFDDWNDFASSTTTGQDPLNSWKQTTIPTDDKASEINLFTTANVPHDSKFVDSFSQEDLFIGEFSCPDVSTEVNKFPMEASILDRATDVYSKAGGNSDDIGTSFFDVETTSKPDDVETILSQMHDLSFMLDSNLSIPSTQQGSNSLSRD